MDPLEQRIGARQRSAHALAQTLLAKLPQAVALLRGLGVERVWLFGSLTTQIAGELQARREASACDDCPVVGGVNGCRAIAGWAARAG